MTTARVLLLLICPLLLLSLAGQLAAAQPAAAAEVEAAHQAADQEALRATVAEQARDLDRLSGKVDGLQTSLDSTAKSAHLVVKLVGAIGAGILVFIAIAGFFGYGKFKDILNQTKSFRDEAADHAKEVADCAQKVRDALKSIESAGQKATEYLDRIKHFADEVQAKARDLQSIQITGEVAQQDKQALADLATRLDLIEALGLPLDPESYLARGSAYYDKGDYERAAQCCEKATQLRAEYHEAWNNWGTALSKQAQTKDVAEAHSLLQQAGEKYARAVEIKPEYHYAWYNWGTALLYRAKTKEGAEADALFQQAGEKYARAVDIKPDKHEAWDNWGYSLASQAAKKLPGEAAPLLEQAFQKLQRALELRPDWANAVYNRGYAHLVAGDPGKALADLKQAINLDPKYREMAKTDPDFEPLRSDPEFRKLLGLDPDEPEDNQP
ncbi:MAG TPA: tetratricopeptide repeat protein [Armatimonadota bacterium]|nr:tetratricopeptide repeat protein [Armatimonadota bacterium]